LADEANKPDELFVEGKALLREGRYLEACAKLSESFRLDPATGTLLALALCQERWGKLASATASYREAALRAHSERNAEREEAATQRVKELEPRLSKLTILVPEDAARITQLTIRRNGEALGVEAWGTPIAIDGGSYLVEASAPGRVAFRVEVTLAADGDLRVVTIPPLATQNAPRLTQRGTATPTRKLDRPNETHTSLPRILSYATGGSAVVAFGLGTFFGLQAKSRNDESNSNGHCTGKGCDQPGFELRNRALSSARASTLSFAMGAALSIASVSLYLGSEPEKPRARIGTRVNTDATSSGLNVTVFGEL
jgi:tetratricopeptide (TPR) repeat protein